MRTLFVLLSALALLGACAPATDTPKSPDVVKDDDQKFDDDQKNDDNDPPENQKPVITSVTLTPAAPTASTRITALANGVSDPDGDTVTLTYAWEVNGVALPGQVGNSLAGEFSKGDSVQVIATPSDGKESGQAVASNALTVANATPVVTSVSLSNATYLAHGATPPLAVTYDVLDADGADSHTATIHWFKNGALVGAYDDATSVPYSALRNGESWVARVTVSDGSATSGALDSAAAVVSIPNYPPTLASASLSPAAPTAGATISLTALGAADLNHGDEVTLKVQWKVNGGNVAGQSGMSLAGIFAKGNSVQAVVTPFDGQADGTPVSSPIITIANSKPVVQSVTLSPASPTASTLITASVTGVSDPDDEDTVTLTYAWKVNGVTIAGQSGSTLAGEFAKGNTVQVFVTPSDNEASGETVVSNVLTVANAAPVVTSVSLSSTTYVAHGATPPLTVSYAAYDADAADSPTASIHWYKNGSLVSAYNNATSVPYSALRNGESWVARVTVSDGSATSGALDSAAAVVSIPNYPPTLASASLSPAAPTAGATISLTALGAADLNHGDEVTLKVQWKVNGGDVSGQAGTTLAGVFAKGDTVQAVVTPFDGQADGTPVYSSTVTIVNSKPVVKNVALSNSLYIIGGFEPPLSLTYQISDGDVDDSHTVGIRWYKNGFEMTAYEDQTEVPFAALSTEDIWVAGVAVHDGTELSEPTVSEPAVILMSVFDPWNTPVADIWDLDLIRDAGTLAETETSAACSDPDYTCSDIRFTSPHPDGSSAPLTTAGWVIMPATRDMTKQLAVLIYMHGTGFSRDRDGMLSLLKSLNTGFPDISAGVFGDIKATHQLAIITVSGPGEEGSNGPDWSTARARLFPDIRQSWDYLFAYIAMRTVTYAKEELAPNRIGMFGASAGGLATLLANGVDDRLDMAMPLSATGYLLESARQTNSWLGELAEAPPAFTMATERFLDPRSYLATQHAPVKLINGAQDEYYPFTSTKLTYDHIKNGLDKNLFVVPNFDHGPLVDQADLTALGYSQAAWINRYLLGHPLVTAGAPLGTPNLSVNGGLVTVTVNVPAQTLNLVLKNVLNGQSVHDVKLWASADNGYTFQSFNMSSTGGSNYQWSGTPSGVWANPSGVAWFVASEDKVTSNIMNFTADYRSTVPMYPAGFTQVLREKP